MPQQQAEYMTCTPLRINAKFLLHRGRRPYMSLSKGAGTLQLRPDLDAIEALSTEREALWSRIDKATFLTANEKRSAVGYGPISGGDEIKSSAVARKFNPNHDDRGRFTFGPNPQGAKPEGD